MLYYNPSRIELQDLEFYAKKSELSNYEICVGFSHKGYTLFNSEMSIAQARELAQLIIEACDAETITPIGEFQDNTTNNEAL